MSNRSRSVRGNTADSSLGASVIMSRGEINNKTGAVMTEREQLESRKAKGMCITCGDVKTHEKKFKITGPKMMPLDVPGKVANGQCLVCLGETTNSSVINGGVTMGGRMASMRITPRGGGAGVLGGTIMSSGNGNGNGGSSGIARSHNAASASSRRNSQDSDYNSTASAESGASGYHRRSILQPDAGPSSNTYQSMSSVTLGSEFKNSSNRSLKTGTSSSRSLKVDNNHNLSARSLSHDDEDDGDANNNNNNNSYAPPQSSPTMSGFRMANATRSAGAKWRKKSMHYEDFASILDHMRKHPDEDSLIQSYKEMGKLALTEEHRETTPKEMQKLIKSMSVIEFHDKNNKMVAQACETLCHFSNTTNVDKKKRIGIFGGITYTISFMKSLPNDSKVQMWACHTLALLEEVTSNRDIILKSDGIGLLLRVVGHNTMKSSAVEWAIRALDALIVRDDRKINPLQASEVVTATANGIQHHKEIRGVTEWGIRILGKIWELHDCSGMKSFRPTVRVITNAIKCHEEDVPIQTEAFALMIKMAKLPDSAMGRIVAPKGLVEHVNVVLNLKEEDSCEYEPELFTTLHEHAITLFYEMLQNNSMGSQDITNCRDCVESVMQLIQAYLCSSDMARSAVSLTTCVKIMEKAEATADADDPDFAVMELIMGVYNEYADLSVTLMQAIHTLVQNDRYATMVADANLIHAIREAIEKHIDNEDVVKAAFTALETIGKFPCVSSALDASDVASAVANALEDIICSVNVGSSGSGGGFIMASLGLSALRSVLIGDGGGKCSNFTEHTLRVTCKVMKTYPKSEVLQFDGCLILRGCLTENNLSMYQCNEDVSEVLFKASEISEVCMKTSLMTIQILYEY